MTFDSTERWSSRDAAHSVREYPDGRLEVKSLDVSERGVHRVSYTVVNEPMRSAIPADAGRARAGEGGPVMVYPWAGV